MAALNEEHVLSVTHWTDNLFSFTTTRSPTFRFDNGQFTMIGLKVGGKPLLRAYSMASANYEETLSFFSIKVPDGPLTSRLKDISVGDPILVGEKATGTLVQHALLPGKTLYLFGTGTGLAPFLSVIKDPEAYDRFEKIVLVHGCRQVRELGYGEKIVEEVLESELMGDLAREKLLYYPTVTREPFRHRGRITELVENGKLAEDLGLTQLSPENDRVMLCGSPGMLADCTKMLEERGFKEGSNSEPGDFVIEKAFVER
ncbi:ferredoxin--NADP reductase [Amorphus sp. 3PC139-8]|uniref:ferredoxin--NADP reductase n=1 Tax=Amorphus sp. 3PC139-8 TaxID=2735676 RepID=UPI00345DB4D6